MNAKRNSRLSFEKSAAFTAKIEMVVPGGAHTYSKGRDQFPRNAPNGIKRGKGAWIWDADDNRLIDWGMGLTSVSLGHGDDEVCDAVASVIRDGVNFTRPAALELDAATTFLATFGGDMVKFAKHGSSVTTAAVKLSRGFTGRAKVAVPREHPFFSFDDWFIGATEADFGIPEELKKFTLQFSYNDIESLNALFKAHPGEIACVIMEPVKFDAPLAGFLEGVRELCTKNDTVLIFDEMVSGLKWSLPGASRYFGVKSDLTTWGKGIANGFSCVALAGKADIMRLGGLEPEGARKLFLLSSTHGAESMGLAAMMKTVERFTSKPIVEQNWRTGHALMERLNVCFQQKGVANYLRISGYPCLPLLTTLGPDGVPDLAFRTLLMQELIARGVLCQGLFVITPSHGAAEVDFTISAFGEAVDIYKEALARGSIDGLLDGPAIKPVFRKFN